MTFSKPKDYAIKKSIVRTTARFAPANDCVLFVLLKLTFVALPSGTVWVDVPSPFVVSGVRAPRVHTNRGIYGEEKGTYTFQLYTQSTTAKGPLRKVKAEPTREANTVCWNVHFHPTVVPGLPDKCASNSISFLLPGPPDR